MELLSETLRIATILQACFVLGVTITVIIAYRQRPLIGHISTVAFSYSLLTLAIVHSLFTEMYSTTSAKGWMVILAFGLGDYALLKIVTKRRNGTSGELHPSHWEARFDRIERKLDERK